MRGRAFQTARVTDHSTTLHVDLDGAWTPGTLPDLPVVAVREWGPRLRFCAPDAEMEAFHAAIAGAAGRRAVPRLRLG